MPAGEKWKQGMDGSVLSVVPWTAELALKAARVDAELPRPDQEAQIQAQIDAGGLGGDAVKALRAAGYDVQLPEAPAP